MSGNTEKSNGRTNETGWDFQPRINEVESGRISAIARGTKGQGLSLYPAVPGTAVKDGGLKKTSLALWGCMKGPGPLHIFAPAYASLARGFGSQTLFANLQPRKARPSKSAEPVFSHKRS